MHVSYLSSLSPLTRSVSALDVNNSKDDSLCGFCFGFHVLCVQDGLGRVIVDALFRVLEVDRQKSLYWFNVERPLGFPATPSSANNTHGSVRWSPRKKDKAQNLGLVRVIQHRRAGNMNGSVSADLLNCRAHSIHTVVNRRLFYLWRSTWDGSVKDGGVIHQNPSC